MQPVWLAQALLGAVEAHSPRLPVHEHRGLSEVPAKADGGAWVFLVGSDLDVVGEFVHEPQA